VLMPPYWTVPLLYPPFIAVLWRPLALLPGGSSLILWWAAAIVAMGWGLGMAATRPRYVVALVVALLSSAIAAQVLAGNVDVWILVATMVAWRLSDGRHERGVGVLIAVVIAVKLTPVVFAWWLLVERRWSAVRWMCAALFVCGLVSILGAGLGANVEYLRILSQTASAGATPLSLAGIASGLGVPHAVANPLPVAVLGISLIAMLIWRERPIPVFFIAVVASVLGSPVVSNTSYTRLLAVLAPVAYADTHRSHVRTPGSTARASARAV